MLPSEASGATIINTAGAQLVWGPFRVPGLLGIGVNVLTVAYLLLVIFFSFWPPSWVVTVQTMNFSVVGTVGVMLLSLIYYIFRARKVYDGPVVEVE